MTILTQSFLNAADADGPLDVVPVAGRIGAEIRGVALGGDLDDATIAAIRAALVRHKVIFFRAQHHLNDAGQEAFAERFGKPVAHPTVPVVPGSKYLLELDSKEGRAASSWHTDVTFIETPPMASILYARRLPPSGGDTIWSNMKAAYEALSPAFREFLASLDAVHDFARGFPTRGIVANAAGEDKHAKAAAEHPPVLHPVIRTHPETGQDGLFVNFGFTERIKGLRRKESDAILNMLFEHIQKPEFLVRWRWSPNAIAFWDNRVTQHYAVNDYLPHRRIMNRATVLGDRPYHRSRLPAGVKAAAE